MKTEWDEAVHNTIDESPDTIREQEVLPREDREFIRNYHNVLKGTQ